MENSGEWLWGRGAIGKCIEMYSQERWCTGSKSERQRETRGKGTDVIGIARDTAEDIIQRLKSLDGYVAVPSPSRKLWLGSSDRPTAFAIVILHCTMSARGLSTFSRQLTYLTCSRCYWIDQRALKLNCPVNALNCTIRISDINDNIIVH